MVGVCGLDTDKYRESLLTAVTSRLLIIIEKQMQLARKGGPNGKSGKNKGAAFIGLKWSREP